MKKTFKGNEIVTNPMAVKGGATSGASSVNWIITDNINGRTKGTITDNIIGRTKGVIEENIAG